MAAFLARNRIAAGFFLTVSATGLTLSHAAARSYSSVEVTGTEFISPEDIRAACDIYPGEYDSYLMAAVEDCLRSSGQFGAVEVRGSGERLLVSVEELNTRPGRVEVGLAWDSRDGPTANLYFERYNLFPGTFGAIDLRFAEEVQSLTTALYRADAFGDIDIGFDTELRQTSYSDQGFDSSRIVIEPYLAMPFNSGGRAELGLGYRRDEMDNLAPGASALFATEVGVVDAPFLRLGVKYSSNPAERAGSGNVTGLSLSLDQYLRGIGTDHRLFETRIEADARYALSDSLAVLIGFHGGILRSEGGSATRAIDRFFLGGADFRGFAPRGMGPKDGSWFTGANNFYVSSIELQRDIDQLFGTSARAGIFADIGSAWGLDNTLGGLIDDSRELRSSVGLSLTVDIGTVPVALFVAKPVDQQPGDERQSFGISFSTSF